MTSTPVSSFWWRADRRIQELKIVAVDHSILDFTFSNEKQDPPMSDKLFAFQLPAGAQWDEGNQ